MLLCTRYPHSLERRVHILCLGLPLASAGSIHRAYHHCIRQQSYAKHCSSPGLLFSGAEILQSDTLKVYSTPRLCPACDGSHSQATPTYCIPGAPDRPASPDSTSSVTRYFPQSTDSCFCSTCLLYLTSKGLIPLLIHPNSQHVTYLPSKPYCTSRSGLPFTARGRSAQTAILQACTITLQFH